jgi:hypothetical protein
MGAKSWPGTFRRILSPSTTIWPGACTLANDGGMQACFIAHSIELTRRTKGVYQ